jgi:hypothetical protein
MSAELQHWRRNEKQLQRKLSANWTKDYGTDTGGQDMNLHPLAHGRTRVADAVLTYYVDSVNGSVSGDGTIERPYKTLSQLPSLSDGDMVGLRRGSHWREQVTVTAENVSFLAYGSGNRPIIDCSEILTGIAKLDGYTNVWYASVTPDWGATVWLNVWENDTFLMRATDLANCEATPGTYYPSGSTGTITLYIHPYSSTYSGQVYEYAKRQAAISAQYVDGIVVNGIETRRNLSDAGSLVVGRFAYIRDTVCRDGGSHNVEYGGGSRLIDVQCINAYHGSTTGVMFILFEPDGYGGNVEHIRCSAINDSYNVNISGFACHAGAGGSEFGNVSYDTCTGENLGYFISNLTSIGGTITVDTCTATECSTGVNCGESVTTYNITDFVYTSSSANSIPIAANMNGIILNLDGGTYTINDGGSTTTGIISLGTANMEANITNATFILNNASGNRRVVDCRSTTATLTMNGNTYGGSTTSIWIYYFTVAVGYTSDYNTFNKDAMNVYIAGTAYYTISDYIVGTGQDANSTIL